MPKQEHYDIFRRLGTFFEKAKNRELIVSLIAAEHELLNKVYQRLMQVYYARSINTCDWLYRQGYIKLTLSEPEESGDYYVYSLKSPEKIIFLSPLRDNPDETQATVIIDDFILDVENQKILLPMNKISNPSTVTLYATFHGIQNYFLYTTYGKYLGYLKKEDSLQYLTELRILWNALISQKTREWTEKVVNAICGLPIAYGDGTVVERQDNRLVVDYDEYGRQEHYHSKAIFKNYNAGDRVKKFEPLTTVVAVYEFRNGIPIQLLNKARFVLSPNKEVETFIYQEENTTYVCNSPLRAAPGESVFINNFIFARVVEVLEKQISFKAIKREGNNWIIIDQLTSVPVPLAKLDVYLPMFSSMQVVKVKALPSIGEIEDYSLKTIVAIKANEIIITPEVYNFLVEYLNRYLPTYCVPILFVSNINLFAVGFMGDSAAVTVFWDLTDRYYHVKKYPVYGPETLQIDDNLVYNQV